VIAVVNLPVTPGAEQGALLQLFSDGFKRGHPVADREVLLCRVQVVKVVGHRAPLVAADGALAAQVGDGPFPKRSPPAGSMKSTAPAIHGVSSTPRS